MSSSSVIVRPLASTTEYELHFQFADQEFSPDPSPASARYVQQVNTTRPDCSTVLTPRGLCTMSRITYRGTGANSIGSRSFARGYSCRATQVAQAYGRRLERNDMGHCHRCLTTRGKGRAPARVQARVSERLHSGLARVRVHI